MAPLKYPIGTQSFEIIRNEGFAYADKTGYVYHLANSGSRHVFLSRPRRFGKSLLLSTFEAYFEGKKELFEGLELGRLENDWKSYPVLRFSFGSMEAQDSKKLIQFVHNRLEKFEDYYGVKNNSATESFGDRFGMLIQNVAEKTGKKVVVLIDEYDKGIVEMLHNREQLNRNIELFRPFYAQLKDQDQYLRFAFLTGVSRFHNLTLFSSPNQLQDLSMDPRYAAICGLTYEELDTIFAPGINELAQRLELTIEAVENQLKLKYDGYRFTEEEVYVYNPFSILNCLNSRRLSNYWLTSGGSMKVFVNYLKNSSYDLTQIEGMWVPEERLGGPYSTKDPIPLLFQTGYLTIADYDDGMYRLGIPNGEVRTTLVDQLIPQYLEVSSDDVPLLMHKVSKLVKAGKARELMELFQQIFSKLPHQHFRHNDVEHIYHLVMTLICHMAGITARSELSVAGGDIDMLIETNDYVYVMEFKRDQSAEKALKQIDTKAYVLPWKADGRKVFKIGVEFSSVNRNLISWVIR